MSGKLDKTTLLAFTLIVLIAGSNFVAVKFSNDHLAPYWGAFIRFFLASAILLIISLSKGLAIPKGKELVGLFAYGILAFGISYALLYWALLKVPAGVSSVTITLVSLFTFFLAILHRLEKFKLEVLAGTFIAVLGIFIVFYDQLNRNIPLLPLLGIVLAAICISESGIIVKMLPKIHPVSVNLVGMSVGALMLLLISILTNEEKSLSLDLTAVVAVFYLVAFGTILMFMLWIFVLRRWTATATSYQLVLAPVVTMVLANYLRGETLSLISVFGSLVVISGVYLGAITSLKK